MENNHSVYSSREQVKNHYQHMFRNTLFGEMNSFQIDILELISLNKKQKNMFLNNPTQYLLDLKNYLVKSQQIKSFQDFVKIYQISINFVSIPYMSNIYKRFDQINQFSINQWVILTGTVIQSTQKKTLQKNKVFLCDQCGAQYRLQNSYQNYYRFQMPNICDKIVQKEKTNNAFTKLVQNFTKRKNPSVNNQKMEKQTKMGKCGSNKFSPSQFQKVCIDYLELRIQEPFKHIQSGKLPKTLTIIVQGDLANDFRPGDDITVSGVLDFRYKKPVKQLKMQCQMVVFANHIIIQKQNRIYQDQKSVTQSNISGLRLYHELSVNQNSQEMLIIRQLSFRDQVISSFCPRIFGRDNIKLALILSLLSGVSYENENSKIRGQSHILLIGQPGTGKSVLIQQAANLADRSFFTNGIGTSSAGLSVSYYKDGADWTIEAGALVLADNGVCCIDQLTLLAKKDQKSLLQAMEQQTISSAKASVVGKFNARATIIAACNPITPTQKYQPNLDIQANTGLSLPLLTRFDLILIMKDENDRYQDNLKCDYLLQQFIKPEEVLGRNNRPLIKKKVKPGHYSSFGLKSMFKKCKLFNPQLVDSELFTRYYTNQRKNKSSQHSTTARAFESLCRLAQAHAKLMLRQQTCLLDCVTAIMLIQNKYFSTFEEYYLSLKELSEKYEINLQNIK